MKSNMSSESSEKSEGQKNEHNEKVVRKFLAERLPKMLRNVSEGKLLNQTPALMHELVDGVEQLVDDMLVHIDMSVKDKWSRGYLRLYLTFLGRSVQYFDELLRAKSAEKPEEILEDVRILINGLSPEVRKTLLAQLPPALRSKIEEPEKAE